MSIASTTTTTTSHRAALAGGITATLDPSINGHTLTNKRQPWTKREDELLCACVPTVSTKRLAFIMDRTQKAVMHRIHWLGLRYLTHPRRFWENVKKTDGCWLWVGGKRGNSYGFYHFEGKTWVAHRLSYVMAHGPIAPDFHIHHLCHNKGCVNPAHLTPVHITEHSLLHDNPLTRQANQTHCSHGHEFTIANTYRWRGRRLCRACRRGAGPRGVQHED